jgi:hypothetical protein
MVNSYLQTELYLDKFKLSQKIKDMYTLGQKIEIGVRLEVKLSCLFVRVWILTVIGTIIIVVNYSLFLFLFSS